ncbi:MAG: DnaJ domain-containing protein [Halobacteriales archaeon]
MSRSPVVVGLASVFVGLTTLLVLVAVVTSNVVVLLVAVPLGATAGLMWYHASGRLAARTRRRARRAAAGQAVGDGGPDVAGGRRSRPPDGAAPAGEARNPSPGWYEDARGNRWYVDGTGNRWRVSPGAGRTSDAGPGGSGVAGEKRRGVGARGGRIPGGSRRTAGTTDAAGGHLSERAARDRLGVGPDAGESAIRAAYRHRVKEVHPDAEGGDAEAFKRVTAAYERLMG